MVRVVAISGVSGSGKTTALRALEDAGYYCLDNLPPILLPQFMYLAGKTKEEITAVATVIDVRSGEFLPNTAEVFDTLRSQGYPLKFLFLEASTRVLLRRYKETRRRHPLGEKGTVRQAIASERDRLADLKRSADTVIDTSELSVHDLKREIQNRFTLAGEETALRLSFLSFAFRNGLPAEADLVFDVRFLPNPFFVAEMRELNGLDPKVRDFVFQHSEATDFLSHVESLLIFLLPQYRREGRSYLTVAVGCTGGQHRSVALAERLAADFRERGSRASITHRDIP